MDAALAHRLATALLAADPLVRDAVLIGSTVYAPTTAHDIDLVVTSMVPVETIADLTSDLRDALGKTAHRPVDVILRSPGDEIPGLALAILAGVPLCGHGETMEEARIFYEKAGGIMASFKQAEAALAYAEENLISARAKTDPAYKLEGYKSAFGKMFDAARIAAQCYLGREDTRWGGIDKQLPAPYGAQFDAMIKTLHVLYAYDGKIPEGREAEEYAAWRPKVEAFVTELKQLLAKTR